MILDLARQGLTVAAIARRTGHDRKTIRKYIARGGFQGRIDCLYAPPVGRCMG
jgi:IS30 family transposase